MVPKKMSRKIVDSMSPNEIIQLYGDQDAKFINYRIQELQKQYSKKLSLNTKDLKFFEQKEYNRNDGLNIVLSFYDKGRSYDNKDRLGILLYFWFNYRGGICAMRFYRDINYGNLFYFYTSHFIDRYRERSLKDMTISKPETLKRFITENFKKLCKFNPSQKYPNNSWMVSRDGLSFFELTKDHFIIMKTFISWDFLSTSKSDVSKGMIEEAIKQNINFPIPEDLITDSDLNGF